MLFPFQNLGHGQNHGHGHGQSQGRGQNQNHGHRRGCGQDQDHGYMDGHLVLIKEEVGKFKMILRAYIISDSFSWSEPKAQSRWRKYRICANSWSGSWIFSNSWTEYNWPFVGTWGLK